MVDNSFPSRARTRRHGSSVLYGGGSSTCTFISVSQNTVAGPAFSGGRPVFGVPASPVGADEETESLAPPPESLAPPTALAAEAASARPAVSPVGPAPATEAGVSRGGAGRGRRAKSPVNLPLPRCRGAREASPSTHRRRASKATRKYSTLLEAASGQGLVLAVVGVVGRGRVGGGQGGNWSHRAGLHDGVGYFLVALLSRRRFSLNLQSVRLCNLEHTEPRDLLRA